MTVPDKEAKTIDAAALEAARHTMNGTPQVGEVFLVAKVLRAVFFRQHGWKSVRVRRGPPLG
jgi:hypothetical protein